MISINWKQFWAEHVIFGWNLKWDIALVPGEFIKAGTIGSPVYMTREWRYSPSWFDRLWPMRNIFQSHPKWWMRLIHHLIHKWIMEK